MLSDASFGMFCSRPVLEVFTNVLSLSDNARAREALRQCLPEPLRDATFSSVLRDDAATKRCLAQLESSFPQTFGRQYLATGLLCLLYHIGFGLGFHFVWLGGIPGLVRLHTPLASFHSLCIMKRCSIGVRVSGCDTRSNNVLHVLLSICIFLHLFAEITAGSYGLCMA
jgi:hypothetical protein